ncbi:hypothetical protein HK102_002106, partial [Quaeritorhiza haematococci]
LVGLGIKTVVDAVKYVIRWDEVVNTQLAFIGALKYVRENSRPLLEAKREQVVKTIGSLKGSFTHQINTVIKNLKGKGETEMLLDAVDQKGGVAEYTYVTDLIMSNTDKASFSNVNQQTIQQVVAQVEIIHTEVQTVGKYTEIIQQCEEAKKNLGLKGVGVDIVVALLTLVKGVFGILTDIVSVSVDVVIRILEVLVELHWLIMTFEVKIPVVSTLYKYVISNGKYELSLMTLSTLTPAIVYTYAYMLAHAGKAPFPGESSNPSLPLPPPFQQRQQQQQQKRRSLPASTDSTISTSANTNTRALAIRSPSKSLDRRAASGPVVIGALASAIIMTVIGALLSTLFFSVGTLAASISVNIVIWVMVFFILVSE